MGLAYHDNPELFNAFIARDRFVTAMMCAKRDGRINQLPVIENPTEDDPVFHIPEKYRDLWEFYKPFEDEDGE
jgi:hypothetical protein